MRADFIRMTSSTGGAGALTCSAVTGFPAISEAFTGTRLVEYTVAEYTSSAKTQLIFAPGEAFVLEFPSAPTSGAYNGAVTIEEIG